MKPVIGLEVHIELKTRSKMFCGCSADYFGKKPNTHTCPVCLGLPGALPVPNKKAIEWCVMLGMALNCKIPHFSKFDRKNYFYPDLPKGYQISQYDEPFCVNGSIKLSTGKKIRIRRVHMEEDTAKLVHELGNQKSTRSTSSGQEIKNQKDEGYSLIDFNRSGVPLAEIVTEPDFDDAKDVKEYLQKIQQIARYLEISNADMEKGDMRLEPNISLSKDGKLPSYKIEVKNINSFRFVEKAIEFEIRRQTEILQKGQTPIQETRGWDEAKQKTISQRTKEEASDYRYFPEPDIPPIRWAKSQISNLKSQMRELPKEKFKRFKKDYELSDYDTEILTRETTIADYFEDAVRIGKNKNIDAKKIAKFIMNRKPSIEEVLPAKLVRNIESATTYVNINEEEIKITVKKVLKNNSQAVEDFKKGKTQALQYLVGSVMRALKGKVDPRVVIEAIENELK
ncbi:MAG: hypothetical protein A3B44_01380 [Candidatus Levybacteria bacterium RIFCSPLOWO2_01_FULL_38_21]|nr:MAG: hypothetical protein A3B44_01380 [Candidatus Levybacteria bacterium RIFCSPLOWO2_01_FULL_38_21]